MTLWKRFLNLPRRAQISIVVATTALGLVGVAGANATVKSTTTTAAGTPTTAATGSTAVLAGLRIAPEGARAGYNRDLFDHWVDEDGDSCDTP